MTIFYLSWVFFFVSISEAPVHVSLILICVQAATEKPREKHREAQTHTESESGNFVALTFFIAYFNGSAARSPVTLTVQVVLFALEILHRL